MHGPMNVKRVYSTSAACARGNTSI